MGITQQAGRDAEPLAHPHRVLGHLVVGAVQDAHALERGVDPVHRCGLARRGKDPEVLATGQVPVEPGLVHDRPDACEGGGAVSGHLVTEERHRAGVRVGQPEQHADERRLARPVRSEVAERATSGHEQLHAVDGDVVLEPLDESVRLDGPVARRRGALGALGERRRAHRLAPRCCLNEPRTEAWCIARQRTETRGGGVVPWAGARYGSHSPRADRIAVGPCSSRVLAREVRPAWSCGQGGPKPIRILLGMS